MLWIAMVFAASPGPTADLTSIDARAAGLDRKRVKALVDAAEDANSSGLVVLKDGQLVGSWAFDDDPGLVHAMSVTKSIVSLAVGCAIDDGKLTLDAPVHTWFPSWKQIGKEDITVRHLLNHTSGIRAHRTTEAIYASPDFVQLALAADLDAAPGEKLFYNNKATNLLPELVRRAVDEPFDAYVDRRLFQPLGITDWRWDTDPAGHHQGMAGLQIRPIDLAKIGAMMVDGGRWNGTQVVSADWIATSTAKGTDLPKADVHGLLWWRIPAAKVSYLMTDVETAWRSDGVSEDFIAAVAPYKDRPMHDREAFRSALKEIFTDRPQGIEEWNATTWKAGRPDGEHVVTAWAGYAANGYLGQQLLVLPAQRLVVVRMIASDRHADEAHDFRGLEAMVRELPDG
jgi:CubicO group peptidase (beta-lactamase class C family)